MRASALMASWFAACLVASCGGGGDEPPPQGTQPPPIQGGQEGAVPLPPVNIGGAGGANTATVSFDAPSPPGSPPNNAATSFSATCTSSAGAQTGSATASPVVVGGLRHSTTYRCTVVASNATGTSAPSVAVEVRTTGLPTPASVSAALNIDFGSLPNYASPAYPAFYDADVRAQTNIPQGNLPDDRVATLGRVLFYDRSLSINGAVSCASCHQRATGFGDSRRFSLGFSGVEFTGAHSMRLANAVFYRAGSAFWDKRATSLEEQASKPLQHPIEMGFEAGKGGIDALVERLRTKAYYPPLFELAFGDAALSEERIKRALAQFERSIVSFDSKWDRAARQAYVPGIPGKGLAGDLPGFTAEENRGNALFIKPRELGGLGCSACHEPPSFALSPNARSNGLDAGETTVFKSPSLKNVGLGTFFMHDGRFSSLEAVVEHYNSGVQAGPALDSRLTLPGNIPRRLSLSVSDKKALVAFLKTLSDESLQTDPKFADPFR